MQSKALAIGFYLTLSGSTTFLCPVQAQVNSYTNTAGGKWETPANWSLDLSPTNTQSIFITNAANKTVTIDSTTSSNFPSTMTVNSLTLSGSGVVNTLLLTNTGPTPPLQVLNALTIGSGGALLVSNSALVVDNVVGPASGNPNLVIGNNGQGSLTMNSGAIVTDDQIILGNFGGSTGTLTVNGNSVIESAGIFQGSGSAIVWINGGQIDSEIILGNLENSTEIAQLTISNGFVAGTISQEGGTLSIQGGSVSGQVSTLDTFLAFGSGRIETATFQYFENTDFDIGDGNHPATLELIENGSASASGGMIVVSNAFLTGCGTVDAAFVVNFGTITNDCQGGTLTFDCAVTNNARIVATNGATLVFNGPVINNGLINTLGGSVQFNSTITNSGSLLIAGTVSILPETVDFSYIPTGTIGQASFLVTNVGAMTVTGHVQSVVDPFAIVSGGGPFSLPPNNSMNVVVSFSPSSAGGSQENLLVDANGDIFATLLIGVGSVPPVADFDTETSTSGPAPLDVFFADTSTGTITNWFWSFGDGSSTNIDYGTNSFRFVLHTYVAPGTYPVSLIASGPLGVSTNIQAGLIDVTNGTANSYISSVSGKWEDGPNWSLGTPPNSTQSAISIANPVTKTVTIDGATSGGSPATMTISNLEISGSLAPILNTLLATNTLFLSNAGTNTPLNIIGNLSLDDQGAQLVVSNSSLQVGSGFQVGGTVTIQSGGVVMGTAPNIGVDGFHSPGAIWVVGGSLVVTGGTINVGGIAGIDTPDGQLTLSNGTVEAGGVSIPEGGLGASGTLTVAGGTMTLSGGLGVALTRSAIGAIFVTGGQLIVTNGDISLGVGGGSGTMMVSNATVQGQGMRMADFGDTFGASGFLEIDEAGTVSLSSNLTMVGQFHAEILLTGGQLVVTNAEPAGHVNIGLGGLEGATASVTVSNNATLMARSIFVGSQIATNFGVVGTLTVAGGTVQILAGTNGLVVGSGAGVTGSVEVNSGHLLFGNAPLVLGNAGSGSLTVSNGGMAVVGQALIGTVTNSFGSLAMSGGQMMVNSNMTVGSASSSTGTVAVMGGQLTATNGVIGVGNDGTSTNGVGMGSMLVSNAMVLANTMLLGSSTGGHGDLTILSNGLVSLIGSNALLVPNDVTIQGGELDIFNGTFGLWQRPCGYRDDRRRNGELHRGECRR